ncbi:hypothetical protein RE735_05150 [Bacillus aerius]|nr:hypothetical protein [Bacillus aerius]WMT30782.1 hypothetical protein RE735_05150 [Bacillus aerius]
MSAEDYQHITGEIYKA